MKKLIVFGICFLLHSSLCAQNQLFIDKIVPFQSSLKQVIDKDSLVGVNKDLDSLKKMLESEFKWIFETETTKKWQLMFYENYGWKKVFSPKYEQVNYDYKYVNTEPQATYTTQQIFEIFHPEKSVSLYKGWSILEFGEKYIVVESEYYNQPCNAPNSIDKQIYYFKKVN